MTGDAGGRGGVGYPADSVGTGHVDELEITGVEIDKKREWHLS